jgi:5-methylcytosine-specific restriction endonuclease McrA
MAKSVLEHFSSWDLLKIRDSVAYDPTAPNGLKWRARRMGRVGTGIGRTFWIDQISYQAPQVVMILNDKWPGDGAMVVTRINKAGSWGVVENLKWVPRSEALIEGREYNRQELLRKVFGDNIPHTGGKLRLAKLCKRGHKWNGHAVSLQFKDGPDWRCKGCHREAHPLKRDQDAPRISPQERRRIRNARIRDELREQGLTTRGTNRIRGTSLTELQKAIRSAGSPSVARLVMDEQQRHWRENPKDRAAHYRRWAQAKWWLLYTISPDLRLYHREKSKRRKAQARGQTPIQIPVAALRQRFNQFGNCCAYCGSAGDMEIEHVQAIKNGGPHDIGNIVPACSTCNTSKNAKEMESWYRSQPFFSELRLRRICQVIHPPEGQQLPLALP